MIINIENVNKSFGSKHILNNISFSVQEGEIFALIGPNGAGKTTTIRCIFGELMPESGKVEVFFLSGQFKAEGKNSCYDGRPSYL